MLGSIQEAEDVTQEVFIKVYSNISSYKENTQFNSWIYRIAYNECISTLRKRKRSKLVQFFNDIVNIEDISINGYQDDSFGSPLYDALSKLTPIDRTLLILRIVDDKSYEEIAEIMQKKPPALRKQFERALVKLRRILKEEISNESVQAI